MKKELDILFNNIVKDSLELIKEKNVDLDELAFRVGISTNKLKESLTSRDEDFSIYFRTYNLLLNW